MKFDWIGKNFSKHRKRRPIKPKTLKKLLYWLYCDQKKRRHMETGRIRFVLLDPLSRRAIYRGTIHIEYVNQDPDRIEPINIEKISQRYEWEGTKSDWFGLFVASLIIIIALIALYLQSPWHDIAWRRFHPSLTPLVWRIAFSTWSFTGVNYFINAGGENPVFELNYMLLETFVSVIAKASPYL